MAGTPDPGPDSDSDTGGGEGENPRGWVPEPWVLDLEQAGLVEEYVPRVDYDALDVLTVLVFLRLDGDLAELVADHAGPVTDAHETTDPWGALLVTRFTTPEGPARFLGGLATDNRVVACEVNVVARTALEYDTPPLG